MFRRSFLTAALGLAAGTACSRSPSKNAMPRIILAPLFGVWLGLGIASKVALGISLVFFVVFYNVHQGVRQVDPVVLASVRMLGASRRQVVRHVVLPSALTFTSAPCTALCLDAGVARVEQRLLHWRPPIQLREPL